MLFRQKKTDVIDETVIEKFKSEIIQIFGHDVGHQFINRLYEAIEDRESDRKNAQVIFVDDSKRLSIVSGNGRNCWILYTEDGETEVVKSHRKSYLDEYIEVPVINKRVLGKAIVKYIGHEGIEGDKRQQGLRKLLQTTIDYIQTHDEHNVWENATITVYDKEDNKFVFTSNKGKHQFLVNENNGESEIVPINGNNISYLENRNEMKRNGIRLFIAIMDGLRFLRFRIRWKLIFFGGILCYSVFKTIQFICDVKHE